MNSIVQFLVQHGYSVLFAAVFANQAGLPVPSVLFLLAAGALAGSGRLSLAVALCLAVPASMLADWAWYEAGRRWGDKILHFIHHFATDPDGAERQSKKNFAKYEPAVLLVAKFVPGLDAVAPPLAAISGIRPLRFLAFDAAGVSLWSCAYAGLGYAFSRDLNRAVAYAARMGQLFVIVALAGLCIYLGPKLARWCRFIREFRLARITPEELKRKLDAGEPVFIVDLQGGHSRHRQGIPGAVRIDPHRLEQYRAYDIKTRAPLPRDREMVLYCDSPHEFTSARVALAMRGRGFRRVRPLAGGLQAWQERGFPVAQDLPLFVPKLVEERNTNALTTSST
ncbi:MAG TPA: VTT domain-containing protein [Terriglobia bacterium]|nr:VTT domain-containing protein [Terriglobia bacterium]